jgi:arabinogalactan endo-1,4-beta-galactosidase
MSLKVLPCRLSDQSVTLKHFKNGVNFGDYDGLGLISDQSIQSLRNARSTHINWVAIVVTGFQNRAGDTSIFIRPKYTPMPDELRAFAKEAKKMNLRVMLKFHINLLEDPRHWCGSVGRNFNEDQWQKWFVSYENFINLYLTDENLKDIDMICVGNELVTTEKRSGNWRGLIFRIRVKFKGPLVYGANWWPGVENVTWWDALDYIGVSAYRSIVAKNKIFSIENLVKAWQEGPDIGTLKKYSLRYGKPVIFTEIGYRSIQGANLNPYEPLAQKNEKVNFYEQARLYYALYEIAKSLPWLEGVFWWEWDANPENGGINNKDYTPHGKPTEKLIPLFSCIQR